MSSLSGPPRPALLALADGTCFRGQAVGANGQSVGEVVFNTAITGYQEILTDPSYAGQIVTLTYPHIGNTGINREDVESRQIFAAGLVIRDLPRMVSNWRNQEDLATYLTRSNVVGSRARMRYEKRDGEPVLVRLPEVDLVDDKAGKPLGIQQLIGRRPLAAFGNSDGDFEMLEWTTSGSGPRLGVLVHHTDAEREFAYDRDSHAGRLARALDEAPQRSWVVVDMKRDWARVYPFER